MAFRAYQHLREDIWDYRHSAAAGETENVLSFSPSAARGYGTSGLGLGYQAAEMFSGMENHAREAESRAEAMCRTLNEKLAFAEKQRDASERARREVVHDLNGRLREVSRALQQARSRIADSEDRATAAEYRAQAAEVQLCKANQELAAIEQAIRKRML